MKVIVIMNPISGCGRAAAVGAEVVRMLAGLGHDVRAHETRTAGDVRTAVQEAKTADVVICVGGDGTVNEAINGLASLECETATALGDATLPRLAVMPVGTGNVLAKELGLPRTAGEFCAMFRAGRIRRLDVATVRPAWHTAPMRRFLLMAGAGFDAQVVRTFHAARKGPITIGQYFFHSVRELLKFRPPRITIEADGRTLTRAASFVQVANVASYGGPFLFAVGARADDGWLRLMWFTGSSRLDVLRLFCAGFARVPVMAGSVRFGRARKVRLLSDDPAPLQIDGDPAEMELPVEITIIPRALAVVVPQKC